MATLKVLVFLCSALTAFGAITVYHPQHPFGVGTSTLSSSAAAANYTGAAAYNPTVLDAPPPPNPPINTRFGIQLRSGGTTPGVSIPQSGSFFGFSIEMSVVDQVCEWTVLHVPFLNLISNIIRRAGSVRVRVGGNTQETAVLVPNLPSGRILDKNITGTSNPTQTPPLDYTPDLIYMLGNISALVEGSVDWFLGVPFLRARDFRLDIVGVGQSVLGERLVGVQVGNEPDLYARHGHRDDDYGPAEYAEEFGELVEDMDEDARITNRRILVGPNVATGDWTPEQVWDTGFVDDYSDNLAYLAVEHYPSDNCYAQFGIGTYNDPQELFPSFLNHNAGIDIVAPYLSSTAYAQTKNKRMLMFETNTASCGGFPGISDSFGAALWGLDYAMQMAYSNFSGALFHVGGQNVFYNPFTPPPTNQSTFRQWTIGPIYYSALVMAEALGPSNAAQVLDLEANNHDIYTPAYAIYEKGIPVRVLLFNFITDPSGANDIVASISIGGNSTGQAVSTPTQVRVKYLLASSVSQKGSFTWAGQSFGANFASDGRLQGIEDTLTVSCHPSTGCPIKVPAPGAALVFLSDSAIQEVESGEVKTYATTVQTKTVNTATVDAAVLATSNGHGGFDVKRVGSTSRGRVSGGCGGGLRVGWVELGVVVLGVGILNVYL
ncbi:glycoside hydrolase superfamily [Coprinopsis sp. MPI-PUGE-AT-0042]|nr:glycoside hydrolase superfamily [Coprinopsis sp. MPI-PUGE-AT-0042]